MARVACCLCCFFCFKYDFSDTLRSPLQSNSLEYLSIFPDACDKSADKIVFQLQSCFDSLYLHNLYLFTIKLQKPAAIKYCLTIKSFSFLFFLGSKELSHSLYSPKAMRNGIFNLFGKFSVSQVIPIRLEYWIPAEISAAPGFYNGSWSFSDEKMRFFQF